MVDHMGLKVGAWQFFACLNVFQVMACREAATAAAQHNAANSLNFCFKSRYVFFQSLKNSDIERVQLVGPVDS